MKFAILLALVAFGMPLSARPLKTTGTIFSPLSSSRTNTDRSRSGPLSPPLALAPWQNPQAETNTF